MPEQMEADYLLSRALDAVTTALQSPVGSNSRLASFETAHALSSIANTVASISIATTLIDIRSEIHTLSAALAAQGEPEGDTIAEPVSDESVAWAVGDLVAGLAGEPIGRVAAVGLSEDSVYLVVNGADGARSVRVWADQVVRYVEPDGGDNTVTNADDGDDDWPEEAHEPNPVFAEAVAEAKSKGKKGSKK